MAAVVGVAVRSGRPGAPGGRPGEWNPARSPEGMQAVARQGDVAERAARSMGGAVGDGDEGAGEVVGEAVGGGSGQGGSPAVVEAAGPPAGERGGRRRRGMRDLRSRGSPAGGRHIQVGLAQGGEALEGLAGEADLEGWIAGHASMVPVVPASPQAPGTPTAMKPLG